MIKLELTAETPEDLRRQLSALLGPVVEINAPLAQPNAPQVEPPKRGRPPKDTSATAAEPQSTSAESVASASSDTQETAPSETRTVSSASSESGDNTSEITYDTHIKPAILRVSARPAEQGGGREGVISLLSTFGVDHASKVNVEDWPALLAKVAELEAPMRKNF